MKTLSLKNLSFQTFKYLLIKWKCYNNIYYCENTIAYMQKIIKHEILIFQVFKFLNYV